MAKIVLGMGTSHGPMLSAPPEQWDARVPADRMYKEHHYKGRTWTFDQLVKERANEGLDQQITMDVWKKRHAQCRSALDELARVWDETKPDVAVIVGNDQREIFKEDNTPAMAVFWGDTIVNNDFDEEHLARMAPGVAISVPGHTPPGGAAYQGLPKLGRHIIEKTMGDDFDITAITKMHGDHTPHAFGFIYRQVMKDKVVPNVPVILNTFYPPNQPTVSRCYDFGKSLVKAIESWDSNARVALIASGGLTHFVIDEQVDEAVLDAMRTRDIKGVASLGEKIYQAGTSEVKNWVPVAGAMADLNYKLNIVDYVPCYRSEAGTGNAMGFAYWKA